MASILTGLLRGVGKFTIPYALCAISMAAAVTKIDDKLTIVSGGSSGYSTWSQDEVSLAPAGLSDLTGNFYINVPTTATLSLTQGATAELTLTAGQVAIRNTFLVDTNSLYVDATNNRVGVGTVTPGAALDVVGAGQINSGTTNEVLSLQSSDQYAGLVLDDSGAGSFRLYGNAGGMLAQYYTGAAYTTAFNVSDATGLFTIKNTDGLSVFNVEGGATIGGASYVGGASFTAATGEMFLERNLMMGTATTSGSAMINLGANRTGTDPMIALSNSGSGDAGVLIANAGNVWQWGSRNALTGDPFVIGGGTSPTVTDLIYITKGGEIGVRKAVPAAMVDVVSANDYSSPTLQLRQNDDDQAFISFIGKDDETSPGGDPVSSAVVPTAFGDFVISVRVEVNGGTYWLPLFQ